MDELTKKDSDTLYRAISVPWMSPEPVNLVAYSGFGFDSVFDEWNTIESTGRCSLRMDGWQFVGLLPTEFLLWHPIYWLIFRKRLG